MLDRRPLVARANDPKHSGGVTVRLKWLLFLGALAAASVLILLTAREESAPATHPRRTSELAAPREPARETTLEAKTRESPSQPAPREALRVEAPAPGVATIPAASGEQRLMTELRELGLRDPSRSLRLALEGDVRFPASREEPERGFYAVRALMDLGRTDDAIARARALVEKHPNDPFALDVARHMLTHPMTHPSEVGYAKAP